MKGHKMIEQDFVNLGLLGKKCDTKGHPVSAFELTEPFIDDHQRALVSKGYILIRKEDFTGGEIAYLFLSPPKSGTRSFSVSNMGDGVWTLSIPR